MPVTLTGRGGRRMLALAAILSGAASTLSSQQAGTALVDAAKAQDSAAVRALLAQGVDVNAPYGDGTTALHWAVHWDDRETAERLIGAGARVNAADDHGITPLALACLNGNATIVEMLLKGGANPNLASVVNETPLMTAARTGNADVVRLLLAHGADVNATENARGQTALMHAVAETHPEVVRVLIEHGADVRARSTNRFTPLLFAAQQGHLETAGLLLAAGADVHESAPDGIAGDTNARAAFKPDTDAGALLVAIDSGHEDMARFLIEHGADPNHHGAGRTALHSAVQQAMPELVKALLAHGTDPNARLEKPMPLLSRFIALANGLEPSAMGATPFWLAGMYELFERTPATNHMVILRRADHVHFMDNVEQEDETVRAMPFTEELAWIPKEMR